MGELKKLTIRTAATKSGSTPLRLDQAIFESSMADQNGLTRALVRKLIAAGAVYVNGKRARVGARPLRGGETIDLYWDSGLSPTASATRTSAENFLPLRVLYEDEAVICFDKPAGLPTQPTVDKERANLFDLAKAQLRAAAGKDVYLGMHHRLDRDTSGVVLFTLNPSYNAFIADQFKHHECVKVYAAVVHGKPSKNPGRIENFLAEVGRKGKQAKYGSVKSGGKKAITEYRILNAPSNKHSLLEVKILTGRTHQIRVHLSEAGHPIIGDTLYGSPVENYNRLGRFLLHAHTFSFEHPVTRNQVLVESPIPPEFRK